VELGDGEGGAEQGRPEERGRRPGGARGDTTDGKARLGRGAQAPCRHDTGRNPRAERDVKGGRKLTGAGTYTRGDGYRSHGRARDRVRGGPAPAHGALVARGGHVASVWGVLQIITGRPIRARVNASAAPDATAERGAGAQAPAASSTSGRSR